MSGSEEKALAPVSALPALLSPVPGSPAAEMPRRGFLIAAAAASCVCALGCPLAEAKEEAEKDDDDDKPVKIDAAKETGKIAVGTLTDYAKDGVTDKWAKSHHFFIIRQGKKIYAVSAVCSHKGALVGLDAKGGLRCPKHKSSFDLQGQPTKGPATDSGPLTRFAIAADAKGKVTVDNSKKFEEIDWEKADAVLTVK